MAKYSLEFKLQVVTDYQAGKGSYKILAEKYNIPDIKSIREWVSVYEAFGIDGLATKERTST